MDPYNRILAATTRTASLLRRMNAKLLIWFVSWGATLIFVLAKIDWKNGPRLEMMLLRYLLSRGQSATAIINDAPSIGAAGQGPDR